MEDKENTYQTELDNLERLLRYGDKGQCLIGLYQIQNYPEFAREFDDATDIEYLQSKFFPGVDDIQPIMDWCIEKVCHQRDCTKERVMNNYFDDVLDWFHDQFGTPELAKGRLENIISEYY